MTQEELAHKCGYKSRVSINKIELERDVPIKKLIPIAEALGVTPQELMGWDDDDDMISEGAARSAASLIKGDNPSLEYLLSCYDQMTPEKREQLLNFADFLIASGKNNK